MALAAGAGLVVFVVGVFFLARVVSGATLSPWPARSLAPFLWGYPGILARMLTAGYSPVAYRAQAWWASCPADGVAGPARARVQVWRDWHSGPGHDAWEKTCP